MTWTDSIEQIPGHSIDAYREWFAAFVSSGTCMTLIRDCLIRHVNKAEHVLGAFTGANTHLILFKNERVMMGIRYVPPLRPIRDPEQEIGMALMSNPTHNLVAVLGKGSFHLRHYELEGVGSADQFTRNARLAVRSSFDVESGQIYEIRPTRDIFDAREVRQGVVLVELATTSHDPLVWHFDRKTLRATHATSASVPATRSQFCAAVLRHLGHADAASHISWLSSTSPYHFVRWAAVKHLLHVDRSEARRALERSATDEHPHVRSSAVATLANLQHAGYWEAS